MEGIIKAGLDFIGRQNFNGKVTLKNDEIRDASFKMVGLLLATVFVGLICQLPEKKLAWMVSLVNSFVMTVAGVFYLAMKLPEVITAVSAKDFHSLGAQLFHAPVSNFTALMCMWFLIANVFDLICGVLFYRKQLGILTAWIHHSLFIWTMIAASTGNGGFIQTKPFASAFAIVVIEELPTFLLALGSVLPIFRTDLGFGLTFFIFRICWHLCFFGLAFYNSDTVSIPVRVLYSVTLLMHINWFQNWVTKYGFVKKKKDAKKSIE